MADSWKWWIVVFGTRDYFLYYDGSFIVKGRSPGEAEKKALIEIYKRAPTALSFEEWRKSGWRETVAIFGPFDKEPQEV